MRLCAGLGVAGALPDVLAQPRRRQRLEAAVARRVPRVHEFAEGVRMNRIRNGAAIALMAGAATWGIAPASAATHAIPPLWSNCKHVNARYRHGVGKVGAHDKTSGTPVANFYRSTRLYRIAIHYNSGLDRDKDGIACEKH